jgi:uncharacterized OsmC-like protein
MKDMLLDGRRREELLQYVRNCPVYNTLKANSNISIVLEEESAAHGG